MRATGVVRKVDQLGRIVMPIEIRRNLDVKEGDSLEIFVEADKIILKKYNPSCTFCEESGDLTTYEGKNLCRKCIERIKAKRF